jgi:hypothetical protein
VISGGVLDLLSSAGAIPGCSDPGAEVRLAGNDGQLRGWAYRIRTGESVGELSD